MASYPAPTDPSRAHPWLMPCTPPYLTRRGQTPRSIMAEQEGWKGKQDQRLLVSRLRDKGTGTGT